jgi:hypothetical protein
MVELPGNHKSQKCPGVCTTRAQQEDGGRSSVRQMESTVGRRECGLMFVAKCACAGDASSKGDETGSRVARAALGWQGPFRETAPSDD